MMVFGNKKYKEIVVLNMPVINNQLVVGWCFLLAHKSNKN